MSASVTPTCSLANTPSGLLIYRLYRYRQDFARLLAVSDTTRSRFIRLFLMAIITIVVLTPYLFWILWIFSTQLTEPFSWEYVHGDWGTGWNSIAFVPTAGTVRMDRWGQAGAGYSAFLIFGTGTDAKNTYKWMACKIGLGKCFPSLYQPSNDKPSPPGRFWTWCTNTSSKARSMFSISKNESITEMSHSQIMTKNSVEPYDSLVLEMPHSGSLKPLQSQDNRMLLDKTPRKGRRKSRFGRLFSRRTAGGSVLPVSGKDHDDPLHLERSPSETLPHGVYAHAWASDSPSSSRKHPHPDENSVLVVKEVIQEEKMRKDSKY